MDGLAATLAALTTPGLPVSVPGGAVLVALAVDRWLGEPPVRWHPVVWMGRYLDWAGRRVQTHTRQTPVLGPDLTPDLAPDYRAFWLGALAWISGAAAVLIAAVLLQVGLAWALAAAVGLDHLQGTVSNGAWLISMPGQGGWACVAGLAVAALLLGALLKPLLAWALLKKEVMAVEHALSDPVTGSVARGRERLRWLVSRDVSSLSETQVRESAIETLAENLNDSVVAPIFWFVLLGLPGAALFRFANTADAMWGYPGVYQGHNWAWAGKWAARADDVLGWLPARLTALLLALVARASGGVLSLAGLREQAQHTPSPNSGWPMGAMALALGVRLGKPGGYVLHDHGRAAVHLDTGRAVSYASKALLALVFITQTALVLIAMATLA